MFAVSFGRCQFWRCVHLFRICFASYWHMPASFLGRHHFGMLAEICTSRSSCYAGTCSARSISARRSCCCAPPPLWPLHTAVQTLVPATAAAPCLAAALQLHHRRQAAVSASQRRWHTCLAARQLVAAWPVGACRHVPRAWVRCRQAPAPLQPQRLKQGQSAKVLLAIVQSSSAMLRHLCRRSQALLPRAGHPHVQALPARARRVPSSRRARATCPCSCLASSTPHRRRSRHRQQRRRLPSSPLHCRRRRCPHPGCRGSALTYPALSLWMRFWLRPRGRVLA
jgi:hypothetical protein